MGIIDQFHLKSLDRFFAELSIKLTKRLGTRKFSSACDNKLLVEPTYLLEVQLQYKFLRKLLFSLSFYARDHKKIILTSSQDQKSNVEKILG